MKLHRLFFAGLVLACLCSCGSDLDERVVAADGSVSISPPLGWKVAERSEKAIVIEGKDGRFSIAVLDSPPPSPDLSDLLETLEVMSPGLEVRGQMDISASGVPGKEFIVSYLGEGKKQNGAIYMFGKDGKLCVLTFVVKNGELGGLLSVFRSSAESLRFRGDAG